jgi:hypothetical protein
MVVARSITMPRMLRGGAILTTYLTNKAVILQGRTKYKQEGKFHP